MTAGPPQTASQGPDVVDHLLLVLYLLGIYLGVEVRLSATVPIPAVLSGAAGCALLIKHMTRLQERAIVGMLLVLLLYLGSILSASDYGFLGKRFTGLVQIVYSFAIGYGFFVTVMLYRRDRLARIFLSFCLIILVGCALENHLPAFRALSDAVRQNIYDSGVYVSDVRDLILYGRIRPKLFTSEPSAVTFGFLLFSFAWYVLATWRWKLAFYTAMYAAAFLLMRGPTLMLGMALVLPYEIFLAARRPSRGGRRYDPARIAAALSLAVVLAGMAAYLGATLYAGRLHDISSGNDPSFFSRVVGPEMVAVDTLQRYPIAGIGLTAEDFINDRVGQIYAQRSGLAGVWHFDSAKHALTNYFWSHWIYLGLVWGGVLVVGLSLYLHILGAPSLLFCWIVWAVFGQASGAYVSPKTWTVFYLAAAVALLHERDRQSWMALVPVDTYLSRRRGEPRMPALSDVRR